MSATITDFNGLAAALGRKVVLSMSVPDLAWLADGLLEAASADEAQGVIQHVHVVADGLELVAEATDRYRIHQMRVTLREHVERVEAVISRDVLVWAKRNARTFKPKRDAMIDPVAQLVLEIEPGTAEAGEMPAGWSAAVYREWDAEDAPAARFDAPLVKDAFPDVEGLIESARRGDAAAPAPLALAFLDGAQTLQTPFTQVPVIQFTATRNERAWAHGPALLDFWERDGVLRATAMIQPSKSVTDEETAR